VCCLHAGTVLPAILPNVAHKTTNFANHTPTNLYRRTHLYLRKFCPAWQKHQRYRFVPRYRNVWTPYMVHKACCSMHCSAGNGRQDSPCWVQTAHKSCGAWMNHTSLWFWVKDTQILATEVVFPKVTILLPPLFGHTVSVLLNSKTKITEGCSGPLWRSYIQRVPIREICDGHKMSQFRICDRGPRSHALCFWDF